MSVDPFRVRVRVRVRITVGYLFQVLAHRAQDAASHIGGVGVSIVAMQAQGGQDLIPALLADGLHDEEPLGSIHL